MLAMIVSCICLQYFFECNILFLLFVEYYVIFIYLVIYTYVSNYMYSSSEVVHVLLRQGGKKEKACQPPILPGNETSLLAMILFMLHAD